LRKSRQITGVRRSVFSYLLVMVLFVFSVLNQPVLEGIILVISSLVYLATFLYVFVTTPDDTSE
jgi:Ca2+/Na+ antiporter